MKSLRINHHHLSGNTHVRREIYREFDHGSVYIASHGRRIRINNYYERSIVPLCFTNENELFELMRTRLDNVYLCT